VRILVADDSDTMSALVTEVLTSEGHQVDVARTGTDAWNMLTSESYDMILCDVVLPGLDGLRLYRRLTHERPELVSRLALMSGRTEAVRRFAEATGATFLAKPFQVRDLLECVERCAPRAGQRR